MKYTIIIQWSKEDECYVVSLPDFTDVMQPCTHGDTYEEALKNAQEVLEMLISSYLEDGQPIPEPQIIGKSLTAA
ncbi:type II toxin-antitoxin system HicB family antitoxin [Dolichospermum sp. LEGE 00240]|jgi:predicted RNase H-like HicB family nuclease|uniref:type II toxin-antitoxin system HicB family antitoxin n=1 Tax=Dolichospermum sp. LEGE 00240 TaxID=1828603 RepID=UPI00187FFBFB|nr:type II toxin-antitoxin system HicB family antitoxin [Dolichospermum sp. LEGE 00240]MBS9390834.1 type II toxin-antitoxin system HicB family antitoxin [Dolichospermum sp. WA123]MDK2408030.1 type II toxin-antitoxin system HicB family antitoxin [Aphanizomenon sp. 202]MDK2458507.1 type II toxin-antitoxin system HicB family antitoxin [Aphanizomenon sp. PH219]MDM3856641.1 type II toxin-antitoxin system HicB family antitoxin [Aphanizomenon gracile PMC649.10]MDM3859345.1 type II toxin-antitoxin sys